jgi:hypothetical protein
MKTLVPLLVLLLLAGCATSPSGPPPPKPPAAPAGPQATVTGDAEGEVTDYMGGEIHCRIQSIDGDTVNVTTALKPGPHTVIAVLTSQGEEYVAVIQVGLPEARPYRIRAHRRDDAVTVTLVEGDKLLATSTAPLGPQMKFSVFVKQK